MYIKKIGLSMALALASAGVFAEDSGFYAGVEANRTRVDDICNGTGIDCQDTDYNWGVFGGYNINSTFSAEVGYSDLGHFSLGSSHADVDAWEIAGLAKYPVWGGAWAVYARAGWAQTDVDSNVAGADANSGDWVAGVGAEIPIVDKINVRIDWRDYNNVGDGMSESDVSAWNVAGIYNF